MPICDGLLTADILNDCENSAIAGIEADVLIFNNQEINRTATTFDAVKKLLITDLVLNTGKTGFLLEGVKQVNALKMELVKKELGNDKYKHTFSFLILNPTEANRRALDTMNGGYFSVLVETKFKGALNAEPFLLGGYASGMQLLTATFATNENDGTISVEMSSVDGFEEPKPLFTVLDTDYATTKTAFNAKFVGA
jgi:hypothetical protein